MNKLLAILSLFLIYAANTNGQIKAITERGDTINVYEDGRWESIHNVANPVIPAFGSVTSSIEIDEKTKTRSRRTEYWSYLGLDSQGKTIGGSMQKVNGMYIFSLSFSGDLGCLAKDKSTLKIKLSNGFIIECYQLSKTDCGRLARAEYVLLSLEQSKLPGYQKIMRRNVELLAANDWDMIRLQGSKYYTDLFPNAYKQLKNPEQFFRQHLSALNR